MLTTYVLVRGNRSLVFSWYNMQQFRFDMWQFFQVFIMLNINYRHYHFPNCTIYLISYTVWKVCIMVSFSNIGKHLFDNSCDGRLYELAWVVLALFHFNYLRHYQAQNRAIRRNEQCNRFRQRIRRHIYEHNDREPDHIGGWAWSHDVTVPVI